VRSPASFVYPPVIAAWLVSLFTPSNNGESLQGDLLEEFSALAKGSGLALARRWYWRQSLKTIASLMGIAFRFAPSSMVCAVAGGFFLLWFGAGVPADVIFAVIHKFPIYPDHWKAYVFWVTDGILIANLLESILIGCIVALVAKDREMVATITLGLATVALSAGLALWWLAGQQLDYTFLLPQIVNLLIHTIAIVLGGVIVREFRSSRSVGHAGA